MKEFLKRSMYFGDYMSLMDLVISRGQTTGPKQSPEMTHYTVLNRRRMERLLKTLDPSAHALEAAASVRRSMIWLVITEAWCGDAAQNIPVIEKFAELSDNIETRYILRDENPELMDMFLTEGTRSIPKLIALDADDLSLLGTWGPRPAAAVDDFREMRSRGFEKSVISENLQRWYNADGGQTLFAELAGLAAIWAEDREAKPAAA